MSWTLPADVFGPRYWFYMAAVMAGRLEVLVARRRINKGDIPLGVLRSADAFFKLVNQAQHKKPLPNPPASLNAYVLATDALRESSKTTESQVDHVLKNYSKFVRLVKDLGATHELTRDERQTAEALRKFFVSLHRAGEEEIADRRADFDDPTRRLELSLR